MEKQFNCLYSKTRQCFFFAMTALTQSFGRWRDLIAVPGSLDGCVEKDGTFYMTKDGIFFPLF
jgi:hypothetical protein